MLFQVLNEMEDRLCKFCPYISKAKHTSTKVWDLRFHAKAKHFYCKECDLQYESKKETFQHLKSSHPNFLKECQICGYSTIYTHSLNQHRLLQHFTCNQCNIDHVTESELSKHLVKVHNSNKNFKCDKCDFVTLLDRKLKHHVAAQHTEDRYQCNTCVVWHSLVSSRARRDSDLRD